MRQKHTEQIVVRMPAALVARLDAIAAAAGITRSAALRHVLAAAGSREES